MNIRIERLQDQIRSYSMQDILTYEQLQNHSFGIITVTAVEVSPDYSYATVYVHSQENTKLLPAFLAPCATITQKRIGKDFSLRKIPRIRYKVAKQIQSSIQVIDIINELDRKYELHTED